MPTIYRIDYTPLVLKAKKIGEKPLSYAEALKPVTDLANSISQAVLPSHSFYWRLKPKQKEELAKLMLKYGYEHHKAVFSMLEELEHLGDSKRDEEVQRRVDSGHHSYAEAQKALDKLGAFYERAGIREKAVESLHKSIQEARDKVNRMAEE